MDNLESWAVAREWTTGDRVFDDIEGHESCNVCMRMPHSIILYHDWLENLRARHTWYASTAHGLPKEQKQPKREKWARRFGFDLWKEKFGGIVHSITIRLRAATMAISPSTYTPRHWSTWRTRQWNITKLSSVNQAPRGMSTRINMVLNNLAKWNGRSIMPQRPMDVLQIDASNKDSLGSSSIYQLEELKAHELSLGASGSLGNDLLLSLVHKLLAYSSWLAAVAFSGCTSPDRKQRSRPKW